MERTETVSEKRVKIPIDADLYDRLEALAKKQGVSLQEFVDTEVVEKMRKIMEEEP